MRREKRWTVRTRVTSPRVDVLSHCHTYICAFTSNYPGRGNPVRRRRTASTREDQRTRYSELLHSSAALFPTMPPPRRATVEEGSPPPPTPPFAKETWRNFGQLPNAYLLAFSQRRYAQFRAIIVTVSLPPPSLSAIFTRQPFYISGISASVRPPPPRINPPSTSPFEIERTSLPLSSIFQIRERERLVSFHDETRAKV